MGGDVRSRLGVLVVVGAGALMVVAAAVAAVTSGSLQYSSAPLQIGHLEGRSGQYLTGTPDEVSVFGQLSGRE